MTHVNQCLGQHYNEEIMYAKSAEDESSVGFRAYKQIGSFMIHET